MGDCFQAAFEEMERMENEHEQHVVLCHGICTNETAGTFVHAWVEKQVGDETYVFDAADKGHREKIILPRELYYAGLNVRNVIRYTFKDAAMACAVNRNWGPWDKSFSGIG
jgi:hypothetical protein